MMSIISPGNIIKSHPDPDDPDLSDVRVLVAEHDENGSLGFVINKLFPRTLNDLEEFAGSKAFPLFAGGPVQKDKLYFIHRRSDLIKNGKQISADLFLGGDFKQVVAHINNGTLTENDIRLFLGYCGWEANELEEEFLGESWITEKYSFTF